MFGLGFLSAFVLARRVSVRTTSYQTPELGHLYVSSNAEQYTVSEVPARAVGTEVELELHPDSCRWPTRRACTRCWAATARCCPSRSSSVLRPGAQPEPPPWRGQGVAVHPVQARRQALQFAARFEHDFEPIVTVPLRADGNSDATGLLWVQDGATYGTSDNRNLSVFVRGMLLDDDARDLLPPWAGFIGGVIESSRLTPTASREDLQRDDQYRAVQHALLEALIDGLADVARQQPEAWRRVLSATTRRCWARRCAMTACSTC
jgi:molecular chaperone HtpG